jgi:hypothetical protein
MCQYCGKDFLRRKTEAAKHPNAFCSRSCWSSSGFTGTVTGPNSAKRKRRPNGRFK